MEPSLSSDVEVTMTADFFTQMRSAMTMQRMVVNQMILEQGDFVFPASRARPARSRRARRRTSSCSTPRPSTWRRSTTCRARWCR
jgi:hypothetical protein